MTDIDEQRQQLEQWVSQHFVDAEIFIFGFSRRLSDEIKNDFLCVAKNFFATWKSHDVQVLSDFFLFFDQFFLVCVDRDISLTGCGRDSLDRFVKNYFMEQPAIDLLGVNDVVLIDSNHILPANDSPFLILKRYQLPAFFADKDAAFLKKMSVLGLHFSHVKEVMKNGFIVSFADSWLAKNII